MRSVEGVNETLTVGDWGPAGGLDGAGDFQGQFVEILFLLLVGDFSLPHQAEQVAISGDVVEAMVGTADMRDVLGHVFDRGAPAQLEKRLVTGRVELQQGRADLEALGPLRPAPGGVAALDGEDWRAVRSPPRF